MKPIIKILLVLHIVILCLFLLHNFSGKRYHTSNDMIVPVINETSTASYFNSEVNSDTPSSSPLTVTPSPEDIESINQIMGDQYTTVFDGNINFETIHMAIFRNGNELNAFYTISDAEDTETNLTGTIDINTASFTLSNEDESITFQGLIKPGTQKGDILTGIYHNSRDKVSVNLDLKLSHSIASTLDNRYPFVEAATEDIENFAKEIKLYIKNDKKNELAEMIQYPIMVKIHYGNKIIHTPEEFIQSYEDIITDYFKYKIDVSHSRYLFSNDLGVMMGNGEIWFNSWKDKGLKIHAINN